MEHLQTKPPKVFRAPRFVLLIRGIADGVSRAAAIDDESGALHSAWVQSNMHLFRELVYDRTIEAERALHEPRCMADKVMGQLRALRCEACGEDAGPAADPPPVFHCYNADRGFDPEEARRCRAAIRAESQRQSQLEAAKAKASSNVEKQKELEESLVEYLHESTSMERQLTTELAALSEELQSRFCSYGRGVLLFRRFNKEYLPVVEYHDILEAFLLRNDNDRRNIIDELKSEVHHESV